MYFHPQVSIVVKCTSNSDPCTFHQQWQRSTCIVVNERMKFTMSKRLKHISGWTPLVFCSLFLAALLVACGAATSSSTATPAPTAPPSPTPTPVPMTTFAGNGFTMSYPQAWQTNRSGAHLVTWTNSTGTTKMSITIVPDPNGSISADSLVDAAVKAAVVPMKNPQTESVPPTVTVGGASWSQKSVSGTQRLNAADTVIQAVVLATVHPGNTPTSKGYTIVYSAPKSNFAQANTAYFQPMLQSLKFQP
jgi:hypothetical protein